MSAFGSLKRATTTDQDRVPSRDQGRDQQGNQKDQPTGNGNRSTGGGDLAPRRLGGVDHEAQAELKRRVHEKLIGEIDAHKMAEMDPASLRTAIENAVETLLVSENMPFLRTMRQKLVADIADEVLGFGPLEPLLADPNVSEIMVNAADEIYIESEGKLFKTDKRFRDDAHIMQVIERVIAPLGRRLDESSPIVDARLPAGFRMNAIIPPLALRGPTMTIRKFFNERYSMADLVKIGSITEEVDELLGACVKARLNILIAGGTGSGKTTFLNALSTYIPEGERIVTIEDPAELRLKQAHVVSLETRPANIEGKNQVTQRDLVTNALRMRPDRIIVGEVRAGEAFDMLQAMNTGHEGSISTIHSNSPRDALSRVENMVLMAGFELPIRAIREQVASALDLIIYLARMRDGTRRLTYITEVVGMEGQMVTTQDIFLFHQKGYVWIAAHITILLEVVRHRNNSLTSPRGCHFDMNGHER